MRPILIRRTLSMVITILVLAFFTKAALAAGGVTPGQLVLTATALVFVYIVSRLTESMYSGSPWARQWFATSSTSSSLTKGPWTRRSAPLEGL